MSFLAPFIVDRLRGYLPAAILGGSVIPFNVVYIPLHAASLTLPVKWMRKVDDALDRAYVRALLFVFENVSGAKLHFYGDVEFLSGKQETAIIISNHQSDVDWSAIYMLSARQKPSGCEETVRFILKDVIHYAPLYGWATWMRGFVYVHRGGSFAAEPAVRQMRYLQSLNQHFWMHIFPEGTRFTLKKPSVIDQGRQYCEKKNLQPLRNLLPPRHRAFGLALDNLKGTLDAVYDVTIVYTFDDEKISKRATRGNAPNMFKFCTSAEPYHLHLNIRRIPINRVPVDGGRQREWMHRLFLEKDALLERFYATGRFPTADGGAVKQKRMARNLIPFACFTAALTLLPWRWPLAVGVAYATTLAVSPLLIAWMHVRRAV